MTCLDARVLAREALFETRVQSAGCLQANVAAEELESCGRSALAEIEALVRTDVATTNAKDRHRLISMFPGLLGLWGAYFAIGRSADMQRVVAFLRTLDGRVVATAILALRSVWRGDSLVERLPSELLTFLREVSTQETEVGEVARWWLSRRPEG